MLRPLLILIKYVSYIARAYFNIRLGAIYLLIIHFLGLSHSLYLSCFSTCGLVLLCPIGLLIIFAILIRVRCNHSTSIRFIHFTTLHSWRTLLTLGTQWNTLIMSNRLMHSWVSYYHRIIWYCLIDLSRWFKSIHPLKVTLYLLYVYLSYALSLHMKIYAIGNYYLTKIAMLLKAPTRSRPKGPSDSFHA
jgi:hypothetical protein